MSNLIVRVGQGTETHIGMDLGRGILATLCGTNGKRIVEIAADDATGRPDYVTCERCNPVPSTGIDTLRDLLSLD